MTALFETTRHAFDVDGVALGIAAIGRGGAGEPIVFLHGFGSSKEDYADIVRQSAFDGRPFLAYDAPGCGESACDDLSAVDIPFLVKAAREMLDRAGIDRFHLVGHSMGGLTALMLAHATPERVLSFVNIEGNIAPEDCFLSRQIVEHASDDATTFFERFIERTRDRTEHASALYAANLRHKVRAGAVPSIFSSMVRLSDEGELMGKFLGLPCPKMLMYGVDNNSLSYLADIQARGVVLAEVPACGHFPMYSNPPAMWRAIAEFLPA